MDVVDSKFAHCHTFADYPIPSCTESSTSVFMMLTLCIQASLRLRTREDQLANKQHFFSNVKSCNDEFLFLFSENSHVANPQFSWI